MDTTRPSTDGELALRNLDSSIDARLASVERNPSLLATRRDAVGLLLSRAHYRGTFDDLATARRLADEALERWPDDPTAARIVADVASAEHRFDQAERQLVSATELGDTSTTLAHLTLEVARGTNLETALALADEEAARAPTYATHVARASLLAALERYEDADAAFLDALATYRDVSPFPLAWIAFQRGVMWAEMADRADLARPLYEEAVRRVPTYAVANVHLAELEVEAGERDRAIARLYALLPGTTDPEPAGYLGELLAETDPETARAHVADARARYDMLLSRHPEAFLDHGAEFFAGPGADAARALRLAETNLTNRRNARAWVVALEVAQVAESDRLCAWREEAARNPAQSMVLRHLVESLAADCD
ncbi:MAG: hypothetical protein R3B99_18045 [Polyangiales bacterium]